MNFSEDADIEVHALQVILQPTCAGTELLVGLSGGESLRGFDQTPC